MFQKIIHKLLKKSNFSDVIPVAVVKHQLELIRKESDILAICPDNTGLNWLGIKSGTIALFPKNYLLLQQYYSHSVYTESQLMEILELIAILDFKIVVFRGFPPYFDGFIRRLKKKNLASSLFVFYAGPASEFNESSKTQNLIKIIQLQKEGVIVKIGFNKKGLAEAISEVYKVKTGRYILKTSIKEQIPLEKKNDTIKIGVFGGNTFNKNIHSQVLAALSVPKSEVHVLDKSRFDYLPDHDRIIDYNGYLTHEKFVKVLGSMDVNLYLAFSESWGNVITESLSYGVPCLSTINSGVYDFDNELGDMLVVHDYDNISSIRNQIMKVVYDKNNLKKKCSNYISTINQKAEEMLKEILYN